MSHLTQSMVEQFFELEKESARGVLRKEMDSAMDTIFKQLKRKLMQLVDNVELENEILDGQGDLGDSQHELQLYSYSMTNHTNPISSTSANSQGLSCDLNASNLSKHGDLGDRVHQEQLYLSSNQILSSSINSNATANTYKNDDDEEIVVVKNELGELVNIIPNAPIPSSSSNQSQPFNEQSNDNDDLFDEIDDEDCDCPDCVGDLFVMKEEGDDQEDEDDDDVQIIENPDESNDSNSRQTKRVRFENAQAHDQSNPEQVIIISLNCPQCSQTFNNQVQLNAHLKSVHSIELHRCLYKECNRSFSSTNNLGHHFSTTHPNILKWPCGDCSGQFKSHVILTSHHKRAHQSGVFRCCYPDCQFVGELWQTVHNHFANNHKDLICQYPGCTKRYSKMHMLKDHERTHRSARPYRCKWPQCEFAGSAYKRHAINHIRNSHLKKVDKQNSRRTTISSDPYQYLEVVHQLL